MLPRIQTAAAILEECIDFLPGSDVIPTGCSDRSLYKLEYNCEMKVNAANTSS
jgi:hypothetical protein